MTQFQCNSCNKIFKAQGMKIEYTDPVFGACSKVISECPYCKSEATEYRKPKPVKLSAARGPACGNDCCCMN